jgi:hypothetical protein
MTRKSERIEIDEAVAAVREEEIDLRTAEASRGRVWDRLAREAAAPPAAVSTIRGCADVRELLPQYAQGDLVPARALLVQDHLRECTACRGAQQGSVAPAPWRAGLASPSSKPLTWGHALAASAVIAAGVSVYVARDTLRGVPEGHRAAVLSVSGELYRVADRNQQALRPGDEVQEGEAVRTARGSAATLTLRDGSLVEMGEHAEFNVTARRRDTTVHLERGSIIVQAAKRRTGHLYVASNDCTVAVTGTVFSVSRGVKGSRVAVLEGEVRVRRQSGETVLHPGQQIATSASLAPVAIRDEIAWSRNLDRHLALLSELTSLRKEFEKVHTPGERYESRLLKAVPQSAIAYVAAPNYGQSLAEAYGMFEQRVQQNAVLREWWQQAGPRENHATVADVVARLSRLGDYAREEIVVAFLPGARRHHPLVLAEVAKAGLREFLENELFAGAPRRPRLHFITGRTSGPAPAGADVYVLLRADVVAASPDWATLQAAITCLDGQAAGLDVSPFGRRIADAYRDGAGLLIAADASRMPRSGAPQNTGLGDIQYFIAERTEVGGVPRNSAELIFNGPRRGIPSWLAAPAPMGSLDFISDGATAVVSFVTKDPAMAFDEALGFSNDRNRLLQELARLESRLHVRLRDDLAAALGSEFTIALDGPLLPTPAFKLVAEVYDPDRLEGALEAVVAAINDNATGDPRPRLTLEHEQASGRTFHVLRSSGGGLLQQLHYTFVDGYLVAAPSRALVQEAIAVREGGRGLSRSERLISRLPADGRTHVSALLYQNLGSTSSPLAALVPGLTAGQQQMLRAIAGGSEPTLVYAYGEEERIQIAGDILHLDPSTLVLPSLLERVKPAPARPRR